MKNYFNELKNIFKDTFLYIKKNFNMIFALSLFAFPIFVLAFAFSTTTYALDIDENGITNNVQTISALSKSNLNGAYLKLYVSGGGLGDELPCRWVQNYDCKHILDYDNINFIKQNYNYTAQNNNDYQDLEINGVIYNVLNLVVNDNNTIDITYVGNNTLHLTIDYYEILNYKQFVKFNLIYNNPYVDTNIPFIKLIDTTYNRPTIETNSSNYTYEFPIDDKISDSSVDTYSNNNDFFLCPKTAKTKSELKLTFTNNFGADSFNNTIYESNYSNGNMQVDKFLSIQVNSYTTLDNSLIIDFWGNDFTSSEAYNRLLQQYNTLSDMYNSLRDDYDELLENNVPKSQYDALLSEYEQYKLDNQYGFFNYVDTCYLRWQEYGLNDELVWVTVTKGFNTLVNQGYLVNGGIFNPNADDGLADFVVNSMNFTFEFINDTPYDVINFYIMDNANFVLDIVITDTNNNSFTITKQHNNDLLDNYVTPSDIFDLFASNGITDLKYLNSIAFNYQSYTTTSKIVSANNGSYNLGFNEGARYYKYKFEEYYDYYNASIERYNQLETRFDNLNIAYNDLNKSYTNMLNGNNFANLFFTIAETPFASFKQIWNVDFLGVNLAGFVTGILFIGLLIWVVKKIF